MSLIRKIKLFFVEPKEAKMRDIKDLIENLKGKTPEEKAFYAKKEVLKYGVRIESETLDDFSRAFVYEKFGGRAEEKINCLTLEYLKKEREIKKHCADVAWGYYDKGIDEAIEELEDLQNENKSLVKTLEKYNEEMIELKKENKDLKERSTRQ